MESFLSYFSTLGGPFNIHFFSTLIVHDHLYYQLFSYTNVEPCCERATLDRIFVRRRVFRIRTNSSTSSVLARSCLAKRSAAARQRTRNGFPGGEQPLWNHAGPVEQAFEPKVTCWVQGTKRTFWDCLVFMSRSCC